MPCPMPESVPVALYRIQGKGLSSRDQKGKKKGGGLTFLVQRPNSRGNGINHLCGKWLNCSAKKRGETEREMTTYSPVRKGKRLLDRDGKKWYASSKPDGGETEGSEIDVFTVRINAWEWERKEKWAFFGDTNMKRIDGKGSRVAEIGCPGHGGKVLE